MSYNITKELFEQVTGYEGTIHEYNRECIINGDVEEHISINDFFFMCKEWAYKNGYYLSSGYNTNVPISSPQEDDDFIYECSIYRDDSWTYEFCIQHSNNDSEQQAVFDACMYILDIKKEG